MKRHKNRNRNILLIVISAIVVISVPTLLIIPNGSRVHAIASITDSSIGVETCYLKKIYGLNLMDPENSVSGGTNTVKMIVLNANTQTEIFSTTRTELGVGNCVLDSPKLPNLDINTPLIIEFHLLNSNGDMISQNETTIVYK